MAKHRNKISINQLESSITDDNVITKGLLNDNSDFIDGASIQIYKVIPLPEMISFVSEVVEACIDGETGEYLPEAYDFAIRAAVLTRYANFTLPANLDKQYWLLYRSSAFDQVMSLIDKHQFNSIIRAIDDKIEFKLRLITSSAITKVNEMVDQLNRIVESTEKVFSGIEAEDMAKVLRGVAKIDGLNEEELVKTILDAQTENILEISEHDA